MKVNQLFENEVIKVDADWSLDEFKKVKSDIDDLTKKDKYNPEKQTGFKDRKFAEYWVKILAEAHWRMDFIIKFYQEIMPEFNKIDSKVDKAFANRDIPTLKKCHQEFKDLVIKYDLIKIERRIMHRDTTRLKVEGSYPKKISDSIAWILNTRDGIPKLILQAGRTSEQNARSEKASAAIKARWSSIE